MTGSALTEWSETGQQPVISPPSFVGREQELADLAGALGASPAVVLIEGEAGIGKTRLLQEYLAVSGSAARALVACCPHFASRIRSVRPPTRSARRLTGSRDYL